MKVTICTFNLNNLFSRFNFRGNISTLKQGDEVTYTFDQGSNFKIRKFMGKLVKPKSHETSVVIAERIKTINPDILCVQEVENINVLKDFNKYLLKDNPYPYVTLIEGNDPRLIDVGLLSRLPVGAITSWKEARAIDAERNIPIFGRDLLQVEILNHNRNKKLFTIFNTHLKSNFVPYNIANRDAAAKANNERRKQQAKAIARIIKSVTRPNSSFILTGDMNDTTDSEYLEPFTKDAELNLTDALSNLIEIGSMNRTKYPPHTHVWTHRFRQKAGVYHYHLYDHIWISNSLVDNFKKAFVGRRTSVNGNGSDHDPVWIELEM